MPPRLALGVNSHLPRNGKLAEVRLETGIIGIPGSAFLLSFRRRPIYSGFVYLVSPRGVLGVNVHPRGRFAGARSN